MSHQRMLSTTFAIYGALPGLNEYVDANRLHRQRGAAVKKATEAVVMQYIRVARVQPFTGPVFLSFSWHERDRRRDVDNIAFAKKFILDALVKTGILADDGRKHVVGFSDEFHVDKANPRVLVTIERTSA